MTTNPTPSNRRQQLAILIAFLLSTPVFLPLVWLLYQDGDYFFMVVFALLWLALGRFCFRFLAP